MAGALVAPRARPKEVSLEQAECTGEDGDAAVEVDVLSRIARGRTLPRARTADPADGERLLERAVVFGAQALRGGSRERVLHVPGLARATQAL